MHNQARNYSKIKVKAVLSLASVIFVAKSCKDLGARIGVATPNLFGYRLVSTFRDSILTIPVLTGLGIDASS